LKLQQCLEDLHFQKHINAGYLRQNDVGLNLISAEMMNCFDSRKFYDRFLQFKLIMIHLLVDILSLEFHIDLMIMIVFLLNYKECVLACFKAVQSENFYQNQLLNLNILLNQSFLLLFILKHQLYLFRLS